MSASSFKTAAESVRTTLSAATSLKIVHDNGPLTITNESMFCRMSVQFTDSQLIEIGAGKTWRNNGRAIVDFRSKPETGDADVLTECDKIVTACRSQKIDGVTYRAPTIERRGIDSGWYRVSVEVQFYFDTVG